MQIVDVISTVRKRKFTELFWNRKKPLLEFLRHVIGKMTVTAYKSATLWLSNMRRQSSVSKEVTFCDPNAVSTNYHRKKNDFVIQGHFLGEKHLSNIEQI